MYMQCCTVAVVAVDTSMLLCGVQSFGAGTIAVLHSILDFPTRPRGKSFCCLGPRDYTGYTGMCDQ